MTHVMQPFSLIRRSIRILLLSLVFTGTIKAPGMWSTIQDATTRLFSQNWKTTAQNVLQGAILCKAAEVVLSFAIHQCSNMCSFDLIQLRASVHAAGKALPGNVRRRLLRAINEAHFSSSPLRINDTKDLVSTALRIPWKEKKSLQTNLRVIETTLNTSIFGMDAAKEAILDIIFAHNENPETKIPPICLVGPPGVGKTAFAFAVAKALNLPFFVISATGMTDPDSFFRGFNQAYKAAAPGFFAKSFSECGCRNPVIVIDEIDKEAKGNDKGTIQNILLQILDPIQNKHFRDNFLELNLNVGDAIFITTANDRKKISGPLEDRMIMIEIENYSDLERAIMANTIVWNSLAFSSKIPDPIKQKLIKEALGKTQETRSIRDLKKILNSSIIRWLRTNSSTKATP